MWRISQNQGTEMVVHNRDGKIAWSDSHGNDPYPPKGQDLTKRKASSMEPSFL